MFMAFVLVLSAASLVVAQNSPFVGTWKLNVAKSKFDPGPAPKSQTRTWEPSGKVSVEGINMEGKPTGYGYTLMGDGKEYPTFGSVPNGGDKISSKRINANTIEGNFTRNGKHVETAIFTVSKGGKTLTVDAKGVLPTGQPLHNVTLWEKQ